MTADDGRTDAELLAATAGEPEAFGVFYRRHVRAVLTYLLSRTRRPDLAADLCAEAFAAALEQAGRYDVRRGPGRAWLFAIAHGKLVDSLRRGQVEDRARRRLGMPAQALTDEDLERVEQLVDAERGLDVQALVADLPPAQRDAVRERIVHEREYGDIARDLAVSEAVVRQRVRRGLAVLRDRVGDDDGGRA